MPILARASLSRRPVLILVLAVLSVGDVVWASPRPLLTDEGSFTVVMERKEAIPLLRKLAEFAGKFSKVTGMAVGTAPPVVISLSQSGEESGDPLVDSLEGGLPRVTLPISGTGVLSETDQPRLAAALFLREHYGTNAPAPGSKIPVYPEWLLRGLGNLCGHAAEPDGVSFAKGSSPSLEDFLARRPPPSENLALSDLYDRMAAFLVLSGLRESPAGFREWIGHAESGNGTTPPPWPSRWDMRSVEKRWNLAMSSASVGKDPGSRIPDAARSLADFDRAVGGGDFSGLRDPKSLGVYGRDRLLDALSALRLEANPLVLPLIDRTSTLLRRFPKIRTKSLDKDLAELVSERTRTGARASEVSSYLDWYEATRLGRWSGLFDGALRGKDPGAVRKGPVGSHLDRIEARGW